MMHDITTILTVFQDPKLSTTLHQSYVPSMKLLILSMQDAVGFFVLHHLYATRLQISCEEVLAGHIVHARALQVPLNKLSKEERILRHCFVMEYGRLVNCAALRDCCDIIAETSDIVDKDVVLFRIEVVVHYNELLARRDGFVQEINCYTLKNPGCNEHAGRREKHEQ